MKRMMSWTPTPSHLMKQMPRKRGPRHKGLESTKWNDEISYLGSEKLMSFWAIFLVLHFASLICGNPLFGCYKGGERICSLTSKLRTPLMSLTWQRTTVAETCKLKAERINKKTSLTKLGNKKLSSSATPSCIISQCLCNRISTASDDADDAVACSIRTDIPVSK